MCDHDDIRWRDIALIGSLTEELSEERERERLLKELEPEEDDTYEDEEP